MRTHCVLKTGRTLLLCSLLFALSVPGVKSYEPPFPPSLPSVIEYADLFKRDGLVPLPYRIAVVGSELPGEFAMIVFFHGIAERGKDNEKQVTLAYRPLIQYCIDNRVKAILLFPQCPKSKFWARIAPPTVDIALAPRPTSPMASAIQLLAEQKDVYNPGKIYAVGVSMGGYGVWDLLSRCPYLFSGAIITCGGGDTNQAANLRSIPIHVVHGTQDTIVPVARSRSMVKAIWDAGGDKIVYKELPQAGHEVWNGLFDSPETWDWLFSQ